uniref:Immunoglobulin V-set domain-containing protein n=1 Tax=Myripristis murdjan TaxID=586833 RepID=A0A667YU85_9TELE
MVVHRNHFSLSVSHYLSAGQLQVNVSQAVYQAEENSDVTMEWTFTPIMPLTDLNIHLSLGVSDNEPVKKIYYLRGGVELPDFQHEQFTGRVQVDKDELRKGNIRLHLSRLRTDDSGSYQCRMITNTVYFTQYVHIICHVFFIQLQHPDQRRQSAKKEEGLFSSEQHQQLKQFSFM